MGELIGVGGACGGNGDGGGRGDGGTDGSGDGGGGGDGGGVGGTDGGGRVYIRLSTLFVDEADADGCILSPSSSTSTPSSSSSSISRVVRRAGANCVLIAPRSPIAMSS